MYQARILADSFNHHRLVTFEVTFPRFILPEFNTHRALSRNSASSRAIPPEKLIEEARRHPFIPDFNARVKGMGVGASLPPNQQKWAKDSWLHARNQAVEMAERLIHLGVDKSRVNRLLEPFLWQTVIVTATDWSNFFALRTQENAQPEFRIIATLMQEAYRTGDCWSCPSECYHIPLVTLEELGPRPDYDYWKKVSTGRCARVSYLTHDGKRDPVADFGLHNALLQDHHMSPFEHIAHPFTANEWDAIHEQQEDLRSFWGKRFPKQADVWCRQLEYCGNLHGWKSYRSEIPDEHDFSLVGTNSVPT